jgi:hypothetical protein
LRGNNLLSGTMRLLANALPDREATWWACMCATHAAGSAMESTERQALDAAESWVRRPTDEARQQARRVVRGAGYGLPGIWAAVAASWTPQPDAGADPSLSSKNPVGRAVENAVLLASLRDDPDQPELRLTRFIDSGCDIASGGAGRLAPEVD